MTRAGFQQFYEGGTSHEVAFWADARRKFHEIHIAHASPTTSEAIERIAALYAIEAEIRGSTPEVRRSVSQARAKPLLESMRTGLEATLAKLSRKSDTATAIRYTSSRWQATHPPCGRRPTRDRQQRRRTRGARRRPRPLGRKNYLSCGSNAEGERATANHSMLGSAKLNGLGPELYLQQVLERIANHPISRIADLLPWNLAVAKT